MQLTIFLNLKHIFRLFRLYSSSCLNKEDVITKKFLSITEFLTADFFNSKSQVNMLNFSIVKTIILIGLLI